MKLIDISPFVRYSFKFTFIPKKGAYTSLDCRLFYITAGEGRINVNGVSHNLSKDTLLMWQPGTIYQFMCKKPITAISINFDYTSEKAEHTAYFDPIAVNSQDELPRIEKIEFEDCPYLNEPIILNNASNTLDNIQRILTTRTNQSLFYNSKASALLKECIVDVLRILYMPTANPETSGKIQTVINYIHENYGSTINNSSLAELVGYHPYYLNRIFLQHTAVTMHQYVINFKITMAEHMLITTNYSINEIAALTGFSNAVAFALNFKKKNIISPSEFRKKHNSLL